MPYWNYRTRETEKTWQAGLKSLIANVMDASGFSIESLLFIGAMIS